MPALDQQIQIDEENQQTLIDNVLFPKNNDDTEIENYEEKQEELDQIVAQDSVS